MSLSFLPLGVVQSSQRIVCRGALELSKGGGEMGCVLGRGWSRDAVPGV